MTLALSILTFASWICALWFFKAYKDASMELNALRKEKWRVSWALRKTDIYFRQYAEPENWRRNQKSHRSPIYKIGPNPAQEALKIIRALMRGEA